MFDLMRLFAILFTALALVPAGAHLLELPNKLQLAESEYLTVQRLYRGWALGGVIVVGALLSTCALSFRLRGHDGFMAATVGAACIVATLVLFWSITYPVNAATHNWTVLPSNWVALRSRWEFSHAASAFLNLAALLATTVAVLRSQ